MTTVAEQILLHSSLTTGSLLQHLAALMEGGATTPGVSANTVSMPLAADALGVSLEAGVSTNILSSDLSTTPLTSSYNQDTITVSD